MERRSLGRTKIVVSRIGISSSFGAEQAVYEEAFEGGCNYFTWGTFLRGRSKPFKQFVRDKISAGQREEMVIGLLSYSHTRLLGDRFLHSALRQLGTDYVDCLILGYYPSRPSRKLLDWAQDTRHRGLVRSIGLTTHNRGLVIPLSRDGIIDLFHFRYNAVHRGAETDIFPFLGDKPPGMVSFTATCWGKLLDRKKLAPGGAPLTAGDCYRFVLDRPEVDICMMGVRSREELHQNLAEIERGPLTEEERTRICEVGHQLYGR